MDNRDRIELRHLRYFCAIARAGSFSRAAEELGIQQPPLSQQLRQLEEWLGFALFERHRKGVRLTHGGSTFLKEAQSLLAATHEAVSRSRRSADGRAGVMRLGGTSSAMAHSLFPAILRSYREAFPDVDVRISEGNAATLTERVHAGKLEAAFIRRPVLELSGLNYQSMDVEPMLLVVPHDHALGRAGPRARSVGIDDMAGERFILVRRPGAMGMYGDLIEAFRKAGREPQIVAEVDSMLTNMALVSAGVGVSVVPGSMVGIHADRVAFRTINPALKLVAPFNLVSRLGNDDAVLARFTEVAVRQSRAARKPRHQPKIKASRS